MAFVRYTETGLRENKFLTNFTLGYTKNEWVGDILAPKIFVDKETGQFYDTKTDDWYKIRDFKVYIGDNKSQNVELTFSKSNYEVDEYRADFFLADRIRDEANSALMLEQAQVMYQKDQLEMARHIRVIDQLVNNSDIPSEALTSNDRFDNWTSGTSKSPIEVLTNYKEKFRANARIYPNVVVIPTIIANKLVAHPDIEQLLRYQSAEKYIAGYTMPVELAGMKVVQSSVLGARGGTSTVSEQWGNNILFMYVEPNVGINTNNAMVTFVKQDYQVLKLRQEERIGTLYIVRHIVQEKVVQPNFVYKLSSVLNTFA